MPQQLGIFSRPERSSWAVSFLTLFLVVLAFFVVPFTTWWGLPLAVWAYVRAMPRWVPVWLQWVLVILISAHLAVLGVWSWGLALALTATTVASVYWEAGRQQFWFRTIQEVLLAVAWLLIAWMSGNTLWWEGNILVVTSVLIWQLYRQGKETS